MKKLLILVAIALLIIALLAIRPLLRGTGQVATDTPGIELLLHGPFGLSTTLGPDTEPRSLRAGVHTPARLSRTHERQTVSENGAAATEIWQVSSNGPWGRLSAIDVHKGETTIVRFPAPLAVKIDTSFTRGQASFALQIVGPYDEQYSPLIKRNGKTTGKPKLRIIDERGDELHAGSFEYG
jgi:hypothetical protein